MICFCAIIEYLISEQNALLVYSDAAVVLLVSVRLFVRVSVLISNT